MTVRIVSVPVVLRRRQIAELLEVLLDGWKRADRAIEVALSNAPQVVWRPEGSQRVDLSIDGETISTMELSEIAGALLSHCRFPAADEDLMGPVFSEMVAEVSAVLLGEKSPSFAGYDSSIEEFSGDVLQLIKSYTLGRKMIALQRTAGEFVELLRAEGKAAAANTVAGVLRSRGFRTNHTLAEVIDDLGDEERNPGTTSAGKPAAVRDGASEAQMAEGNYGGPAASPSALAESLKSLQDRPRKAKKGKRGK